MLPLAMGFGSQYHPKGTPGSIRTTVLAYAYDIAILVSCKFTDTASDIAEKAINMLLSWAYKKGLEREPCLLLKSLLRVARS